MVLNEPPPTSPWMNQPSIRRHQALQVSVLPKGLQHHRRRIKTEEKATVVATFCGDEIYLILCRTQCCGSGSARIQTFWPDPDPIKLSGFGSGYGSDHKKVIKHIKKFNKLNRYFCNLTNKLWMKPNNLISNKTNSTWKA